MKGEELLGGEPGEVILPGDDGYTEAATSDFLVGSPLAIARPVTPAGVASVVLAAARTGRALSVRSGGHTTWGTNEGGVVLDLSAIADVEVDGEVVRVGGGARWGDVALALAEHGLVMTSGDTASVGVGGIALGGGIGWMVRAHGLTIDNLLGAELVTARGEVVRADPVTNPDLFWALRGGGGNFGVVTHFELRARRLDGVVAGSFEFDPPQLVDAVKLWRDVMAGAPDELTATFVSMPELGPGMPAAVQIVAVWAGDDLDAARAATAPFAQHPGVRGGDLARVSYRSLLDEDMEFEGAAPVMAVASDFLRVLEDDTVEELARIHAAYPGSMLMLRSLGGAFGRVAPDATALAHRDAELLALFVAFLPPGAAPADVDAVHSTWRAATRTQSLGTYGNFRTDESPTLLDEMYPPATLERLRAVKREWDPENVFRRNHNLAPA